MGKRLQGVIRGKHKKPLKLLAMGVEGVGKTSFGADSDKPIFIDIEDGSTYVDVAKFPTPADGWTYQEVLAAIEELRVDEHEYKTVVVDTLDALEPMVWRFICDRDGKTSIESYGYGKGYVAALDEFRVFLSALERLRRERGMHIILVAHCLIKNFKNPLGPDFDRYQAKLHDKAAALFREWVDASLFMTYEDYTRKDKNELKAKAYGGSTRVIHTERRAAWDAKNRLNLPPQMALSWEEFWLHATSSPAEKIAELRATVHELASKITDEKIAAWVEDNLKKDLDIDSLAKIENKLRSRLNDDEEQKGETSNAA